MTGIWLEVLGLILYLIKEYVRRRPAELSPEAKAALALGSKAQDAKRELADALVSKKGDNLERIFDDITRDLSALDHLDLVRKKPGSSGE